tara:strand:+ start:40176 stop:40709 length:534 start_codon:yes stop_codon:yes gene_type:complete
MNCYIKLLKFVLLLILFSFNNVLSQIEKTHIVEKGETLYSLSKKFDITIQKLKELNNLDDNTLSEGQMIIYSIEEDKIENNNVSDEFSTSRVEVFASSIDGMDDSEKYLALHKTAKEGTIIFVKNQMNQNMVIVRVIGKLPNTGINEKIDIRLSKIAFEKLNAKDLIIPVELTYVDK